MRRHALDPVSLVFGLAFTAVGVLFLAGQVDQAIRLRWLWPFLLLVLGLGILLDLGTRRDQLPAEPAEPAAAVAAPEPTAAAEAPERAAPEPREAGGDAQAGPAEPGPAGRTSELDPEEPRRER
jgi:hypothetical protein